MNSAKYNLYIGFL